MGPEVIVIQGSAFAAVYNGNIEQLIRDLDFRFVGVRASARIEDQDERNDGDHGMSWFRERTGC